MRPIIIMYSFRCYFKLEHIAHYRAGRKKPQNTVKTNFRKHAEEMCFKEPTRNEIIFLNHLFLLLHGLNCDLTKKKKMPCWRKKGRNRSAPLSKMNCIKMILVQLIASMEIRISALLSIFKQAAGNTAVSK